MNTLASFKVGDRVQLHPATDRWMRGDRYGIITKLGRKYATVRLDKSGATLTFLPSDLLFT